MILHNNDILCRLIVVCTAHKNAQPEIELGKPFHDYKANLADLSELCKLFFAILPTIPKPLSEVP